ncbi:hypothetical protein ONZ45_g13906 [Pleurotus djamor]|nr:hypothetical protein ONZ45_g13906 [Pleurotus djamor]
MEFWNYQVKGGNNSITLPPPPHPSPRTPLRSSRNVFDCPSIRTNANVFSPPPKDTLPSKYDRRLVRGYRPVQPSIRRVVHRIQQIRQPSLIIQRTDTIVIARETRPAGLDQQTRVEEVSSASASASTRSKTVDPSRTHKRSAVFIDPMNFALPSEVTEPDSDIRSVMGLEGRMSNEVERALSGLDWIYSTDDTWVDPRPSRPSTTATI